MHCAANCCALDLRCLVSNVFSRSVLLRSAEFLLTQAGVAQSIFALCSNDAENMANRLQMKLYRASAKENLQVEESKLSSRSLL